MSPNTLVVLESEAAHPQGRTARPTRGGPDPTGPLADIPPLDVAAACWPASGGTGSGGDWFDVVPVTATTTAVVVGNVVGRRPHAASRMMRVRGVLKSLLSSDPGTLFTRAYELLPGPRDLCVGTAAVFLLNAEAHTLTYVRAGHPPGLLRTPGGELVLLSGGLTAALGLAAGTLTPACVPFDVGSTLIAYTDGLVEPRGRTLDEGVAALAAECRALPSDPQQSAAALVRQLLIVAPTGNAWRNDDVTVVAVRRS